MRHWGWAALAVTMTVTMVACGGEGQAEDAGGTEATGDDTGSAESTGSTPSTAGDTTEGDAGEDSSGEAGSDGSSEDTGSDTDGGEPAVDGIGIFSLAHNYFELQGTDGPIRFHFGSGNSKWGAASLAFAGDWTGDGTDTVALYDNVARAYVLAEENDSDEGMAALPRIVAAGVPEPPPAGGEFPAELPVAGDWDGDGVDGVGLYHPGSRTVYLIDDAASGTVSGMVVMSVEDGWPERGSAVAGDWDGDGDDELAVVGAGTAYLAADTDGGPPAETFAFAAPVAVAGDWDGDGVDTIGAFTPASNTFSLLHHNGEGAMTHEMQLGYTEPGYWSFLPVTGRWRVPESPVAGQGYEFDEDDPGQHGFAAQALTTALDDGSDVFNVTSVLVLRHGVLVGERYFHGYDRHIAGNIKSVSKGVLSALYGIAIEDGAIAGLDAAVSDYLPDYFGGLNATKHSITVGDMMTMRGGLDWSEGPSFVSGGMVQAPDFVDFVLEQPMTSAPGSTYNYSTGLTHVGSAALTEATGLSTREFARQRLFEPLGIAAPRWDASPEGYYTGGAEMWLRPRDMARFGELFLAGGTLDGEAILTAAWVTESANPWIPESGGRNYGLWWRERNWSSYPANDSYFAWGYGGQFIFLFPSWNLQVVVTSRWNVDGAASGASASAIWDYVDDRILPTVQE
ncbi:MAG: serine hydrolase [Myxococcota bacterium]